MTIIYGQHARIDNVSREIKNSRKNKKEMLEIKNIVIEINSFDALIRGLDRIEKRISEV